MGIGYLESEFESKIVAQQNQKWEDIKMCELGCMERRVDPVMVAKEYYLSVLNVQEHISLDISGKLGSLAINLDREIPTFLKDRFNLVTNYGTGEHVNNQYSFFRNIHELCRINGIMIHALVPIGHWINHGRYYYNQDFTKQLAQLCGYELIDYFQSQKYVEKENTDLIMVAYKKVNDSPFISENEFYQNIPILDTRNKARTGNYLKNTKNFSLKDAVMNKFKRIKQTSKKIVILLRDNAFPDTRLNLLIKEGVNCPSTSNDPKEKLFLYDEAVEHIKIGRFLEVGSYLGSSAIILAEALRRNSQSKEAKVYCIDTWENDSMLEGKKDTYQQFQDNIKPWQDWIIPIRGNSDEVKLPFEGLCDVVFIDADHSYEGCRRDVERFSGLVRNGGCLILDDHISYPGVTKVVGELLVTGKWYVGNSYDNLIALYRDETSNNFKRKRIKNKIKSE